MLKLFSVLSLALLVTACNDSRQYGAHKLGIGEWDHPRIVEGHRHPEKQHELYMLAQQRAQEEAKKAQLRLHAKQNTPAMYDRYYYSNVAPYGTADHTVTTAATRHRKPF